MRSSHHYPGFPARVWLLAQSGLAFCALIVPVLATAEEAPSPEPARASLPKANYATPMGPGDPYNRGTPQGSLYGFMSSANDGDFEAAAEYLDLRRLPAAEIDAAGPRLARELKTVLDQTLVIDFEHYASQNAGSPDDGLPAWQDPLGVIAARDGEIKLLLQRVPRVGDSVRIWKVSAATVDRIPELYSEFGYARLESYLPGFFFEWALFDVELWQWLGIGLAIALAWIVSWFFATIALNLISRVTARVRKVMDRRVIHLVRNPVRIVLGVLLFYAFAVPLDLPPSSSERLLSAEKALLVVAVAWLLLQFIDLFALVMQQRIQRRGDAGAAALVSPAKRTLKGIVFVLAFLFALENLGFNVGALIAGVGVGGIAIALAAQKTVEHFFGGVMLVADRPVRVGDFCKFGDQVGTVEAIGLRSTRIRTLDRTLITVPNGEFSNLQIENFAPRDRIRLHTQLGLRYETTPEQLRFALTELRELLVAHPKVDPDPARVRFVGFGPYSLDVEVYAYLRTADWNEFLQIREDLFLRMMDAIDRAGSAFAFPSTTTYIRSDSGLDAGRAQEVQARVDAWRDSGELPFPDLAEGRRAELEDTLDWPPHGSNARPRPDPPEIGTDEADS